ncbi:type II toxin-antitoxin system RelE/ParE family toxin [Steroidobacter sp.]|uniref:type II toxin-antitoxin system RelE/ParE family toxin n=1 Tax=Steroidobacter sp. TaxID=1978227 RepID=UPI0039C98231
MRVYWTPEARVRLREICNYIARDSPMVAREVTARVLRRTEQLAMPPLLGRRLPEYPRSDLAKSWNGRSGSSTELRPGRSRSSRSNITGKIFHVIRGASCHVEAIGYLSIKAGSSCRS